AGRELAAGAGCRSHGLRGGNESEGSDRGAGAAHRGLVARSGVKGWHIMSLKDPNLPNPKKTKRIAIVLANPAVSTTTGWPVGFWWSELTHTYFVLTEKGYEVEIFSPNGGKCEADAMSDPRDASGYSATDLISMGFIATPKLASLVDSTKPVEQIDVAQFDAIVVAGGQAPMFTFEGAHSLHKKFVEFYEAGKI